MGAEARRRGSGECRIIAGRWRGRRLHFADAEGLRPTPDRVRETLFNWLQPKIAGARCLDLFAGSGALGLEAASRGARRVVLVEKRAGTAERLRATLTELGADDSVVVQRTDALDYLAGRPEPFDCVFVDPPYASELLGPAIELLAVGGWLATGAWIYVEQSASRTLPPLPPGWHSRRRGNTREVGYHLLELV